ncbi:MAG: glycoside hydrolase, partial [Anaerolineae bacterium]|nr:glycoside hydrolase [Anaerolineae bacterium]
MKRLLNTVLVGGTLLPLFSAAAQDSGAFFTGSYRNVLAEWGLGEDEIKARLDETWQQLFYGDDNTERVYYPVGEDMAYVLDVANKDVRSEGMSYG